MTEGQKERDGAEGWVQPFTKFTFTFDQYCCRLNKEEKYMRWKKE